MGHAEDDPRPPLLVIAVTEDLLIAVAEIAVDLHGLLLFAGAGQVLQPFRSGELRRDFRERRQELAGGDAQQRDVIERIGTLDLHLLLRPRIEFARLGNAQRICAGLHLREFVLAVGSPRAFFTRPFGPPVSDV